MNLNIQILNAIKINLIQIISKDQLLIILIEEKLHHRIDIKLAYKRFKHHYQVKNKERNFKKIKSKSK